jgi:hypothetical protein
MDRNGRFALVMAFAVALGAACSAGQEKGFSNDGGTQHDSGTTTLPDGAVVLPDGAMVDDTSVPLDDSGTTPDTTVDPGDTGTTSPPTDSGGTDASDGAVPATYSLVITPKDTTVMLPSGSATAQLPYYASLVSSVAYDPPIDVTASTNFTIDDATIGTFTGKVLTYGKIGNTAVRATYSTYTASTYLTVTGPQTVIATGAPADAATKFGGAVDAAASPTIVYPADGVILPPNMSVFEFQFTPGGSNNLFEMTFKGTNLDLKVYFGCTTISGAVGTGCGYSPDATVWKYLAEGGRGQAPVTYTLRGVNTATGKVSNPATRTLSFGLENIVGGLYYWNAGAGTTMRYEFGVSGASAEKWMNVIKAGGTTCVGCHAISHRGHRIALGLDIPGAGGWKVFDVATRTQVFKGPGQASFFAFAPDEKQIITSTGSALTLRDMASGAAITGKLPTSANSGSMPDWSLDGQHVVFAKVSGLGGGGPTGTTNAVIQRLDWNGTAFTDGGQLASVGKNSFYPAFSPGSDFVIFNSSPSDHNSYDAWDAEMYAVKTTGGTPIRLAKSIAPGAQSWPKPYVEEQRYRNGGKLVWVTFSSRRTYGLRINPSPGAPTIDPSSGKENPPPGTAQIWMTAIDPAKIAAGQDGSYPSFWFPFQDITSGNHIGQWVKKVERVTCATGAVCQAGETCVNNQCVGGIK